MVRTVVGYHRYDTASEMLLLNEIWLWQSKLTNYYHPQQKLVSKVRHRAKVTRKYDTAAIPFHRLINHPSMIDHHQQSRRPRQQARTLTRQQAHSCG